MRGGGSYDPSGLCPPPLTGRGGGGRAAPGWLLRPRERAADGQGRGTPKGKGGKRTGREALALLEPSSGRPLGATPGTTRGGRRFPRPPGPGGDGGAAVSPVEGRGRENKDGAVQRPLRRRDARQKAGAARAEEGGRPRGPGPGGGGEEGGVGWSVSPRPQGTGEHLFLLEVAQLFVDHSQDLLHGLGLHRGDAATRCLLRGGRRCCCCRRRGSFTTRARFPAAVRHSAVGSRGHLCVVKRRREEKRRERGRVTGERAAGGDTREGGRAGAHTAASPRPGARGGAGARAAPAGARAPTPFSLPSELTRREERGGGGEVSRDPAAAGPGQRSFPRVRPFPIAAPTPPPR